MFRKVCVTFNVLAGDRQGGRRHPALAGIQDRQA
jgi:hypothetical protein